MAVSVAEAVGERRAAAGDGLSSRHAEVAQRQGHRALPADPGAVARRLQSAEQLQHYLDIALDLMERTTGSIHGHHTTFPSPGLPEFFAQAPNLLNLLSLAGLKNWVEYGIRNYGNHPERQEDYFSLQSADSRAVLQRERHGTLFADVERKLDLYLRALWQDSEQLVPYSTAFDELRKPIPYYDKLGMRVPDVFDDAARRHAASTATAPCSPTWSATAAGAQPQIADNWSPFQRMAVEFFEDCRIETLLIREYPGLRRIFLALHPKPVEDACDPETTSCLRHRLAMLSRALLDPGPRLHAIRTCIEFVARFHALAGRRRIQHRRDRQPGAVLRRQNPPPERPVRQGPFRRHGRSTTATTTASCGNSSRRATRKRPSTKKRKLEPGEELQGLPPRHYPEWDYQQPDLPARLGQRLRSAASRAATRPTSTACWPSTPRWPSS